MPDHTDDHEFGADLGTRYLGADPAERQVIQRQLWAGAADQEHATASSPASTGPDNGRAYAQGR